MINKIILVSDLLFIIYISFGFVNTDVSASIASFGQHVTVKHRDDVSLQCLTANSNKPTSSYPKKVSPTWTYGGHNLALGNR